MKRVRHDTSPASASKRSRAPGSRSIAISRPSGPEPLGDEARVTAGAERAVDGDVARLGIGQLQQLGGEDGNVLGRHREHLRLPEGFGEVAARRSRAASLSVVQASRSQISSHLRAPVTTTSLRRPAHSMSFGGIMMRPAASSSVSNALAEK